MLNLIRKFLKPTLREQLEDGVRDTLRRYADRRIAPDLRVYVSTDLVPNGVDPELWSRDEATHLRSFASQWAQDNGISRAGLRLDIILLDTKRDFAFVKPIGLDTAARAEGSGAPGAQPLVPQEPARPSVGAMHNAGSGGATLEVVSSQALHEPLRIQGDVVLGRRAAEGVLGLGDRYMSSRHARLRTDGVSLWVTDLDSKNRTFVNDQPLAPHQERKLATGDTLRLGTTVLRLARVDR